MAQRIDATSFLVNLFFVSQKHGRMIATTRMSELTGNSSLRKRE